ncbi:hypothetical protein [Magnetovibrio sp.]|uniref:hypothetical protein n=1 Tax=Magnetovibrio sp. TaxID=2024836 RepID=UPI002F93DED9
MSETPQTNAAQSPARPQIPRTKIWVIGGLFLIAAIGMYAGTMYRIQNYGYVGLGADQPIKPGAELTN